MKKIILLILIFSINYIGIVRSVDLPMEMEANYCEEYGIDHTFDGNAFDISFDDIYNFYRSAPDPNLGIAQCMFFVAMREGKQKMDNIILELGRNSVETALLLAIDAGFKIAEEYFIANEFSIAGRNSDLEDAKLILLGDPQHDLDEPIISIGFLINLLAKEGDVILFESCESMVKFPDELVIRHFPALSWMISAGIQLLGWENNAHHAEHKEVKERVYALNEKSLSMDVELEIIKKKVAEKQKGAREELQAFIAESKKMEEEIGQLERENNRLTVLRNKTMIQTIENFSARTRIFVIGGQGHFKEASLLQYLNTKRYINLEPRIGFAN